MCTSSYTLYNRLPGALRLPHTEPTKWTNARRGSNKKILDKRKLRIKWQTTRSPQDKAIFNKATHELKLLLNDLKQQAIQSYLETLTATEATEYSLWKATKRLNRPQTHIPPLRTAAGDWAKSDTQKAHVLADHFAHVFQPYDSEIPDVEERKILHPKKLQVVWKPQPKNSRLPKYGLR